MTDQTVPAAAVPAAAVLATQLTTSLETRAASWLERDKLAIQKAIAGNPHADIIGGFAFGVVLTLALVFGVPHLL